jgi:CHC2 zinc finger
MIIDANTKERTQRYRGVSSTRPIDAAKEAVLVIDLAARLAGTGKMRRVGKTWATNCLLPNHEDRTPSFVVYPETNSWYCFSCLRGGDVVELARLAWGYDQHDAHIAAANLLMEFGFEVPQRPPAWYGKQKRQAPVRRALEDAARRRCQRRLYRWLFAPVVARLDDEDERLEEARSAWEDAGELARLMARHASQSGRNSG